jgi:hypothetical protein
MGIMIDPLLKIDPLLQAKADAEHLQDRLCSLSRFYHENRYLIMDLAAAMENIEDSSDLQAAKVIAHKALDLIIEKRDDCYPNLYPPGQEFHTGHLYTEYFSLSNPRHAQVFEPRTRRSAGIKEQ